MSYLVLDGVEKSFGDVRVIHHLDLTVEEGEFVVFVGASGCGKSTTLRMIAGLETPSAGQILIAGRDITRIPPPERDIAMVFQSYALYPHMSVRRNMEFGLKIARVPKPEIAHRIENAARILGLTELLDRKPSQLSGGQRQRVAMGRAIVREPKVFLFDEPLSNLDAKLRAQMRVELALLHKRLGKTAVYVTHDQVEAMTLADRIVVFDQGFIQQVGTPEEVFERPANIFVAGFIGNPSMNLIAGELSTSSGRTVIATALGPIPIGPGLDGGVGASRRVIVGLRPSRPLTRGRGGRRSAARGRGGGVSRCRDDARRPAAYRRSGRSRAHGLASREPQRPRRPLWPLPRRSGRNPLVRRRHRPQPLGPFGAMTGIFFIGQAAQDLIFAVDVLPREPVKYRARGLATVGGGLSANAAVAVSRLGGRATLIARLGDDAVASDILDELARENVDASGSRRFPGRRTPVSVIAVEPGGERMILNYSDPDMPEGVEWLPPWLPPGVRAVMGDIRWEAGTLYLAEMARIAGVPTVVDADRAIHRPDLLRAATHLVFSAVALSEQTGISDSRSGLIALAAVTSAWLAVTDGARGTWFAQGGRVEHVPAVAVDAVDTLAAGDTFHGALTLAIGEGMSERDAVRFASAAAAAKCTRFGGRAGMPDRRAVEDLMRQAA